MASPGGNISFISVSEPQHNTLSVIGRVLVALTSLLVAIAATLKSGVFVSADNVAPGRVKSILLFVYGCFLKPHSPTKNTQQDALESFYRAQAGAYDATRKYLLMGRREMLALTAAQLVLRLKTGRTMHGTSPGKMIWVDVSQTESISSHRFPLKTSKAVTELIQSSMSQIGGGTGWNIEAMSAYLDVPTFFENVYLVDFSPSLCDIARRRFDRLGWSNVKVVCEDARRFRLRRHEPNLGDVSPVSAAADLVTMSYSLSMIPDYFSLVDSIKNLLAPHGVIGVVDFYVQSQSDFFFRNYTGGVSSRHVGFLARAFWRTWFEFDRVSLDPSRRDYLEYRFGSVLSVNSRHRLLGFIPYYVWIGCHHDLIMTSIKSHKFDKRTEAVLGGTDSILTKYLLPSLGDPSLGDQSVARSEMTDVAFKNMAVHLPLPSAFYQNHPWRIYYDDSLPKHTQFRDEYIYAFTWEDSWADQDLLRLGPNDVVLALTSAGDNILAYARHSPARIHAVDLNPAQNHLLELKVAACAAALPYDDFWRLFGEGRHLGFLALLLSHLSPYLSSRAFQYWLRHASVFSGSPGRGLYYDLGGSRHALRCLRWVSRIFRLQRPVRALLECKNLGEQREIWHKNIRPALFSLFLCRLIICREAFLWAALGVHRNQLSMIEEASRETLTNAATEEKSQGNSSKLRAPVHSRSRAVLGYMKDTFEPVAEHSHIAADNPYYYVCLAGHYSPHCHPEYLSPKAHASLSRPGALDGLSIHTDELNEVIQRMDAGTLTVAVIMDSMDWFDPGTDAAATQISALSRSLCLNGRILLRSSVLSPWYVAVFESLGFNTRRVGARAPGHLVDRVNMYASTWICTKVRELPSLTSVHDQRS